MNFSHRLIKYVCSTLVVTNFALGFYNISWAAPQDDYNTKVEGYNSGMDFLQKAQESVKKLEIQDNGDIKFNDERLDSIKNEDGSNFNINQLSPDQAHPENADKYYVSGKLPNVDELKGIEGISEDELDDLGKSNQDLFEEDAKSDTPTVQGSVFGVVNSVGNQNRPDLDDDPMLNTFTGLVEGMEGQGNPFTDCNIDYQIMNMDATVHNPDYVSCLDQRSEKCQITHNPVLAILKYVNNKAVYGRCGENCITYYLGDFPYDTTDPLKAGSCSESTLSTELQIVNKEAIVEATIESVTYAGSVLAYLPAGAAGQTQVLFGYDSNLNEISASALLNCSDLDSETKAYPQVDITDRLKEASNGDIFTVYMQYKGARPFAMVNVTFDPTKVARNDTWQGTNQCLLNADAIEAGELEGTIKCVNDLTNRNGTVISSGVQLNPKYLLHKYGLEGSCAQAEVAVNYDSVNDTLESNLNELPLCKDLKEQGCGYVSSRCVKYGTGEFHDICLISQNTYDCGYANDLTVPHTTQTYECPGAIACMGTDCLNVVIGGDDTEKDFNKALGLLQESQQAANDMSCKHTGKYDENDNEILDCSFFSGYAQTCVDWARALPGDVIFECDSCCSGAPVFGDWAQVVRLTLQTTKVGAVKMLSATHDLTGLFGYLPEQIKNGTGIFADTAGIPGMEHLSVYGTGWDLIKGFTGIGNTIDSVTTPITNSLNNLIPYAGYVFEGALAYSQDVIIAYVSEQYIVPAVVKGIDFAIAAVAGDAGAGAGGGLSGEGTISKQISDWAVKKLTDAGMEQATAQATVNFVGTAITVIGWIYAAYSVLKIVNGLLCQEKCEDSSDPQGSGGDAYLRLQSNILVKKCENVGRYCSDEEAITGRCIEKTKSYCCFNSPLSRILNKQIKYALKGCGRILWPNNNPSCAFGPDEEHPDCSAITLEQLNEVDWTQVDLTEWLELLKASDVLSSEDVSLDSLATENFLPSGGVDQNGNLIPSGI